jgi:hypothetical protein
MIKIKGPNDNNTIVMNENRKHDTMEEMVLTSEKSPRCRDPKMPHCYVVHIFSIIFSIKDAHFEELVCEFLYSLCRQLYICQLHG